MIDLDFIIWVHVQDMCEVTEWWVVGCGGYGFERWLRWLWVDD